MELFALDSWVYSFFKNVNMSKLDKLNVCKPIFERIYNIKINAINISEEKKDLFSSEDFDKVIENIFENMKFSDFFNNAVKEKADFNMRATNRYKFNERFSSVFLDRLIYNSAINAYISLKYYNNDDSNKTITAKKLFSENKGKQKRSKKNEESLDDEYEENYAHLYKNIKLMFCETLLGKLMGIKGNVNDESYAKYEVPNYQCQLTRNLISSIKSTYLYVNIENEIRVILSNNASNNKENKIKKSVTNNIKKESFFEDLFYDLDKESNEADKIVSYYIVERLFCFNLIYDMVSITQKFYDNNTASTDEHLLRNIYNKFMKQPNEATFEEAITAYISINNNSYAQDIVNDIKEIIERFTLLFKIPDIAGRSSYFALFLHDYHDRLKKEKPQAKEEQAIVKEKWLNDCENFLKYIYYYFIPQVDFIFLYMYEDLKNIIGYNKMEQLLGVYIKDKGEEHPMSKRSYMEKVYHQGIIQGLEKKDTAIIKNIINSATESLIKIFGLDNIIAFQEQYNPEKLILESMADKLEQDKKSGKELEISKDDNTNYSKIPVIPKTVKEYYHNICSEYQNDINKKIQMLINEKMIFANNGELNNIRDSCDQELFKRYFYL